MMKIIFDNAIPTFKDVDLFAVHDVELFFCVAIFSEEILIY